MNKNDLIEDILQPLRGPVLHAHRQSRKLLERDDLTDEVRQGLLMIRSMCARAENVFSGAHLLQDINSLNLKIHLSRCSVGQLFTLVDDAADDMTALLDPERQLKLNVHEKQFHPWASLRLSFDSGLVNTAVRNILENAARYSFRGTAVDVLASYTPPLFTVIVRNRGLRMTAQELQSIADSGYRGHAGMLATGEDSGIGLWLVSRIMQSHQGTLSFHPAPEGATEVHMAFPCGE